LSNDQKPFEVFYDSQCPLCRREIEMIRNKDKQQRMTLTDIADPNFNPAYTGKTLDQLMKEIHGRYDDGTLVVGVDVFREIYGRLGFDWLVKPTRLPVIGWVMDRGYDFFARLRYRSALKRYNKNACEIPVDKFPDRQPA
jgi:predicted DCC family thiol-disulfide oxidoreductase YuxK